ncbi:hypothetical protein BDQ17DRAFT_1434996 [Cyathus striatus]|nr:hypothetical protein BDQ17DRAFT_1434996 [Cyathus striatus]
MKLDIPLFLTSSDTVLYNWTYRYAGVDEEGFNLCSARIELSGVEALGFMHMTMDEIFVSDAIAINHITSYLDTMAHVINPFSITTRFSQDSDNNHRKWVYEGVDDYPEIKIPTGLSGTCAAGRTSTCYFQLAILHVSHEIVHTP